MSDKTKMILVGVVSLIVGAAAGGGFGMMQTDEVTQKLVAATQEKDQAVQNADRMRKMNDDAAKKYGRELGKLVTAIGASTAPAAAPAAAPASAADDAARLIDGARAILAARDGFRASLDGVRASMNSEFDALAAELGNATQDVEKVKQVLDTLKQGWPNKEKAIEDATRKLMVDLGLLQAPAAPKPAAAPAPAPASAPAEKK